MEVYDGTRKNEIFRKFGQKNPRLELVFNYKGEEKRIFVKNESYNLTGSIKDRMAFYTLKKAYEKGEIKKGAPLQKQQVETQVQLFQLWKQFQDTKYISN